MAERTRAVVRSRLIRTAAVHAPRATRGFVRRQQHGPPIHSRLTQAGRRVLPAISWLWARKRARPNRPPGSPSPHRDGPREPYGPLIDAGRPLCGEVSDYLRADLDVD